MSMKVVIAMSFKGWWKNLALWKKGGLIGFLIGILKVPIFVLIGEYLPNIIINIFSIPDIFICNMFKFGLGERCGFFVITYGLIYNPLFYMLLGIFVAFVYNLVTRWHI